MKVHTFGSVDWDHAHKACLTVGTFDGVHRGHQGLIELMRQTAHQQGERVVVVTFDPHPQIVLQRVGREPLSLLTSIEERCELLAASGVDDVVIIPFTKGFASTPADVFIRSLVSEIAVQHFFIGHDHAFGKDRGGNEELLRQLGAEYGFDVCGIPPLDTDGVVVSSTKVRNTLKQGDVATASMMLGRPYSVRGVVMRGDGRGRTLGIPTANVVPTEPHKLLPANGVYVVTSCIGNETVLGMANIGLRPTFTQDTVPTLEVHYLNMEADLYDSTVDVEFHQRLRTEQKFNSREDFLAQLQLDKQQTETYQYLIQERRNS